VHTHEEKATDKQRAYAGYVLCITTNRLTPLFARLIYGDGICFANVAF